MPSAKGLPLRLPHPLSSTVLDAVAHHDMHYEHVHYYVPSPNQQKTIRRIDEVIMP